VAGLAILVVWILAAPASRLIGIFPLLVAKFASEPFRVFGELPGLASSWEILGLKFFGDRFEL
jgi:hypothetical protein